MSKHILNIGTKQFLSSLEKQNTRVTHIEWQPQAFGNKHAQNALDQLKDYKDQINQANQKALHQLDCAQAKLTGMALAGEVIPNMTKTTLLHAGPPIEWKNMSGPLKGAILGALVYETLAPTL